MLVRVKEYINKHFATCKVFVTCKKYIRLSKKHTQMKILDSQSYVPLGPNDVFWLAQKCLTLFAFVAVIKIMCC